MCRDSRNTALSVQERLRLYGAFKTFKAIAESLKRPENYGHEDIFSWSPSVLREFLEGLLQDMSADEQSRALRLLNPDSFDFGSVVPVKQRMVTVMAGGGNAWQLM